MPTMVPRAPASHPGPARADQSKTVAQPLDRRSGREDGAFEGIVEPVGGALRRVLPEVPGDGGQESLDRWRSLCTEIHEHEAPGAVGDLGVAGQVAAVPE